MINTHTQHKELNGFDLSKSYDIFSLAAIILIIISLILGSVSIYNNFWRNLDYQIEFQSLNIEKAAFDARNFSPKTSTLLQHQINRNFNDDKICYIVIDSNHNLIAGSFDVTATDFSKVDLAKSGILENSLKPENQLSSQKFRIKQCVFVSHRTALHQGLTVITGFHYNQVVSDLWFQLLESFVQSVALIIILLILVYVFRRIKIKPFTHELAKSKLAATAASITKNKFISNMSHELRTPMNGIIGMSHVLRNSGKLRADELEQVNTICRSSESLLLIIDDIINFSEIETHKIVIDETVFDIRNLIEDTANIMSSIAYSKGLEIIIDIDEAIPHLLSGSPTRIRQILTKLINNSIKFTDHGEILVAVKLERSEDSTLLISFNVSDSGIGIHEEEVDKMFTAFTQADMSSTKKYGGTGLGLFICKELVELMNGQIGVRSEYKKGSTFYFTLPLRITNAVKAEQTFSRQKLIDKRIAYIENSAATERLFSNHFDQLGLKWRNIHVPRNLEKPLQRTNFVITELLKLKNLDAILLNNSPQTKLDAIDIAKKIKSTNELKNIPLILAISTHEKIHISAKNLSLFKAILSKPVRRKNLLMSLFSTFDLKEDVQAEYLTKLNTKHLKVLLCEDNEVNLKVMLMLLKKIDITPDVAQNGQEAVDSFLHKKYDLILMDCMMPIMDGFEATKKIREIEKEQNVIKPTPIIALTANVNEEDKQKCLFCGMNDFIPKPIRRETLERIFKQYE